MIIRTLSIDENNRKFISTISTAAVGSYNKIVLDGQGVIITQVTDRRNIVSKYDVAVIKRAMDFSKETYGKAYNDFSSFLAGNPKAEDIEANAAQAGYTVQTRNNLSSTEHNVANVRSTRDALRWIFDDKTKVGDVSPLYECGDNDHMLVITLTGIHKKGYLPWDDEQIRTFLTGEVMKDKKAAMLQEKLKGAKSIADVAKIEGAVTDTIHHITFMSNAFVSKIGASEPALSGSVSKGTTSSASTICVTTWHKTRRTSCSAPTTTPSWTRSTQSSSMMPVLRSSSPVLSPKATTNSSSNINLWWSVL